MIGSFTRIIIKNPLLLKSSLENILDTIQPHITYYQLESIEHFIRKLPESVRPVPVNITTDCRIDLISCLNVFWSLDSTNFMKEDLKSHLIELERQLKRYYLIHIS